MCVYFTLFFLIVFLAFLCHKTGNVRSVVFFFILSWLLLSVVEGLRAYDVGTDTHLYVGHFMGKEMLRPEIGYRALEGFLKIFTSNPTVLLVALALIINGLVLTGIYLNSDTAIASVLLYMMMYYYFNTYNTARQYIAVAISLIAFYFAVRRHYIRFVIMVVLAMCFHSTSIVCIVLAVAGIVYGKEEEVAVISDGGTDAITAKSSARKMQWIVVALTVAASGAFAFFLDEIIDVAVSLFPKYAYYLSGSESYLVNEGGGISQPVVYTSILAALLLFVPAENKYKKMLLVPACAAVVFSFLQIRVLHAARFLWYFDIYSVFTIPCILKYGVFPEKLRRLFIAAAAVVCFAFMVYYLKNDMQGVLNYSFVFGS